MDLDIMMNGAVLDKVVLKCETKEQEKMTVTFHDLKMPKHEKLRGIEGENRGEIKSRKHKEHTIFKHLLLSFYFICPR